MTGCDFWGQLIKDSVVSSFLFLGSLGLEEASWHVLRNLKQQADVVRNWDLSSLTPVCPPYKCAILEPSPWVPVNTQMTQMTAIWAQSHERSFFFKILFIYSWQTQRNRQRHRQREKQAPCGEPVVGLDPRIPGSWPEPRQTLNHWTTQVPQWLHFLSCLESVMLPSFPRILQAQFCLIQTSFYIFWCLLLLSHRTISPVFQCFLLFKASGSVAKFSHVILSK